jgi:hypothetical protein
MVRDEFQEVLMNWKLTASRRCFRGHGHSTAAFGPILSGEDENEESQDSERQHAAEDEQHNLKGVDIHNLGHDLKGDH